MPKATNDLYQYTIEGLVCDDSKSALGDAINNYFNIKINPLLKSFGDLEKKLDNNDLTSYPKILQTSKLNIERIYNERTRTNRVIFFISIVLVVLAVGFVIAIGIMTYQNEGGVWKVKSYWEIIVAVISFITGGVLFWFYNKNDMPIRDLEKDIRFLAKLEGIALTINSIKDNSKKIELLKDVILELQK